MGGAPFAFVVMPGDKDKLLIHFMPGGACFSPAVQMCTRDLVEGGANDRAGVFNKSDVRNPFKDHTIVMVPYCSGDLYIGNSNREVGKQFGYQNALSAVQWSLDNLNDGSLQSFVVSGNSAGALGTQFWSRFLLSRFESRNYAVLADSYAGIAPGSKVLEAMRDWKSCDLQIWSDKTKEICAQSTDGISAPAVFHETIASFPHVRFSHIQSKEDPVQKQFYCALQPSLIEAYTCQQSFAITELYYKINDAFATFNELPNWVAYMVNGDRHTFTENEFFYTASPAGKDIVGTPMMYTWVGDFLSATPSTVATVCSGPWEAASMENAAYCDERLKGKTLTLADAPPAAPWHV